MTTQSLIGLGHEVNIQNYRHIAIAISRRYFGPQHHFQDRENNDDEHDPEEATSELITLSLQAAHSVDVKERTYGRQTQEQASETFSIRERYREISLKWQEFLGLGLRPNPPAAASKRPCSSAIDAPETDRKRAKLLSRITAITQLQKLIGRTDCQFRHVQEPAIQAVLRGHSSSRILACYGQRTAAFGPLSH